MPCCHAAVVQAAQRPDLAVREGADEGLDHRRREAALGREGVLAAVLARALNPALPGVWVGVDYAITGLKVLPMLKLVYA